MNVEDCKLKHRHFRDMVYSITKRGTCFPRDISQERWDNYRSIVYSLSHIAAKNCHNWLMCVEVIACNIRDSVELRLELGLVVGYCGPTVR